MQTDKFTALVRNAVLAAQNDAIGANHQKITAMHLLRALLADDNVTVRSLIGRAGGDLDGLSAALDKGLAAIPAVTGSGAYRQWQQRPAPLQVRRLTGSGRCRPCS